MAWKVAAPRQALSALDKRTEEPSPEETATGE